MRRARVLPGGEHFVSLSVGVSPTSQDPGQCGQETVNRKVTRIRMEMATTYAAAGPPVKHVGEDVGVDSPANSWRSAWPPPRRILLSLA